MSLVIIESPYAGGSKDKISREWQVYKNVLYARYAMRDSMLNHGESPIASHLLYTQKGLLDDEIPEERSLGIKCGLDWREVSNLSAFYIDYGMSDGMKQAMKLLKSEGRPYVERILQGETLLELEKEVLKHSCKHVRPLWI